ncbi:hypothetical protein [Goodfellowiella coeruleoviolacea]|nr:hypothetical protein [Goodfellowiella coeruleoviolacea]
MNSRAWRDPFHEVAWGVIVARFHELAGQHPELRHMAHIVDSVVECGGEQRLAALTSVHDLIVTARPVPQRPPIEVVIVRSPWSGYVGAGGVFIEHRSITGHDDRIFRPSAEAVPLFWRFMSYKFGVEPVRERPPSAVG